MNTIKSIINKFPLNSLFILYTTLLLSISLTYTKCIRKFPEVNNYVKHVKKFKVTSVALQPKIAVYPFDPQFKITLSNGVSFVTTAKSYHENDSIEFDSKKLMLYSTCGGAKIVSRKSIKRRQIRSFIMQRANN